MSTPRDRLLIDAGQLAALPRERLVLLDVSRQPTEGDVIPGAIRISLEDDLSGPAGGVAGRYPLPAPAELTERFRQWGIHDDSTVIVYAAAGAAVSVAARAWFVLRWAGVRDVRLLDGGFDAWTVAGRPAEPALSQAQVPGTAVAVPGQLPTLDADEAAAAAPGGWLFDTRGTEQFGLGHIPGATSLPVGELYREGRLLPPDELKETLGQIAEPGAPAAYCGGGVAATGVAFAFATLGVTVPVYIASWTGWTADDTRPVEVSATVTT